MNGDKTFSVDTPEESSGFLLWQVTNLWQRGIKKLLEQFDLTHPQFVLLASMFWFYEHQESVTQIRLSNHTKIDPMTTSTVLRTLQSKGFIRRKEHETDTRAKTVELTESGIKVVKLAIKAIEKFDNDFFDPLGNLTNGFNRNLMTLLNSTPLMEE